MKTAPGPGLLNQLTNNLCGKTTGLFYRLFSTFFLNFEIILGWHKRCKKSKENSHILFIQFLPVITSSFTMVAIHTIIITKPQTICRIHQFPRTLISAFVSVYVYGSDFLELYTFVKPPAQSRYYSITPKEILNSPLIVISSF